MQNKWKQQQPQRQSAEYDRAKTCKEIDMKDGIMPSRIFVRECKDTGFAKELAASCLRE